MGACSSVIYMPGDICDVVSVLMPLYYVHDVVVTPEDIHVAKDCWGLIIENKSEEFLSKQNIDPSFRTHSCMSWFFNSFYERLFDVHPLCKPLFKSGLQAQGRFLIQMISTTLGQLKNPAEFKNTMRALTIRHCERGVKAIEYGVVGEVLFHTIKKCVGPASFTSEVSEAWVRVYSAMLQEIVPLAVHYERKGLHKTSVVRPRYAVDFVPTSGLNCDISSAISLTACTVSEEEAT